MAQYHRYYKNKSIRNQKANNCSLSDENHIFQTFKLQIPKTIKNNRERLFLNQISNNIDSPKNLIQYSKNSQRYAQFNNNESKQRRISQKNTKSISQISKSGLIHQNCGKQNSFRQRPKSSGSCFKEQDESCIKRSSFLFSFAAEQQGQSKLSASRALAKYCKVQRNKSNERFKVKVKKEKNFGPMFLSTRRIVFQVKEKRQKQKASLTQSISKHYRNSGFSKKLKNPLGQEYELKGWEYE